jgi:hypothetical protein
MKRDMDLIRAVVLKAVEGDPNGAIPGYTEDEINYHRALAVQKGLLEGRVLDDNSSMTDIPLDVFVLGVPWAGHDFIDAIESDSNWSKVKAFLSEAGKQVTIETIKYAAQKLFGAP